MTENPYYKCIDGKMQAILPIKDICEALEVKFKDLTSQVDYWKDRFESLTKSDKEYQKLKAERDSAMENLYRGFGISKEEDDKIRKWLLEHRKTHLRSGSLEYVFIPTSVGTIGKVRCSCGEEFTFCEL